MYSRLNINTDHSTVSQLGDGQHGIVVSIESESGSSKKHKNISLTKSGNPRKSRKINNGYPQSSDADGPLFLRPSDQKLVHLHCCVIGCNKAYWTNVTALMAHLASPRQHGFGKGFLKDHVDTIEKCGRLPRDTNPANFVQIPPRDGREAERTPLNSLFPSTSPRGLVHVSGNGIFRNIRGHINDFLPSEWMGAAPESKNDLAYSTGMGILHLGDEAMPEYVLLANGDVTQDMPSNNGFTSKEDSNSTLDQQRLHEIGQSVLIRKIKSEPIDGDIQAGEIDQGNNGIPSAEMGRPMRSSFNGFPTTEMWTPEEDDHGFPYARALTYPEPRVLTAPRKRHASLGTGNRQFFKKFC